jgi:hypothetical protein
MSTVSIIPQPSRVHAYTIKRLLDATIKLPPLSRDGFRHPGQGRWVMLPEEFALVLAHEPKAVTQVLLEIYFQTVGVPGEGPGGRKLWARLSTRHFVRKGLMSHRDARNGLQQAVEKGYIYRRPCGKRAYEYAIHFKDIQY